MHIIPNWHPVFVHFPIAFATAAVAFIITGMLFKDRPWAAQSLMMGRWMLVGAAVFACVAAAFGWMAYNSVPYDEAGRIAVTAHRNWALAALAALIVLAGWTAKTWQSIEQPSYGFLFLLVAMWLLIAAAAWHGGEAVYRHGLGVMALPDIPSNQEILPGGGGDEGLVH